MTTGTARHRNPECRLCDPGFSDDDPAGASSPRVLTKLRSGTTDDAQLVVLPGDSVVRLEAAGFGPGYAVPGLPHRPSVQLP